jgi:hypothetical protein
MKNLKYILIACLSLGACSSKTMSRSSHKKHPVTSVSRVPDEPEYKRDQRLNKYTYETSEDKNSGALGPGTGESYGSFSSRSSSMKRDYADHLAGQKNQVNPRRPDNGLWE